MRGAALLGLRLAGAGAGPARLRAGLMTLATAIGTMLMLTIVAIAHAEQLRDDMLYTSPEMRRLLAAVVLSVALPVLVLVATAGRLSAQLRDRRLGNLRLLGLTPLQTRTVAAVEAATAAVIGLLVGRLLFVAVRLLLPLVHVAGRHWTAASLTPSLTAQVVVLGGVLVAVLAVAVLPQRLSISSALVRARRSDARRPSFLRVLPLLVGIALCGFVIASARPNHSPSDSMILAFFAGVGLLGIGLILLVPVLVRLLADLLLRVLPGPTGTVAARRLQAQPVGVTRVVSGLLIGLFLVTGAHGVVAAFETTGQYQQAARQIEHGQRIEFMATPANAEHLVTRGEQVKGVRRVLELPLVMTAGACQRGSCLQALVATCAQLRLVAPALTGCRDGQPMWLHRDNVFPLPRTATLTWFAEHDDGPLRSAGPLATVPTPVLSVHGDAFSELQPLYADVLLPPSAIAASALPDRSEIALLVLGVPGRGLLERLQHQAFRQAIPNYWDFQPYDYVARLRALVWAIAAVILSVGLLSFAVAALDRSVARRREVVSLQLVGVPSSLLRRVQWIEAGLPIVVGTLLAIGLGLFGGATYLSIGGVLTSVPVSQALALAGIAGVGALLIVGLTVLGASPRIRPDLIRAE